ncbi:alginate export family protein [Sphingomonas hankyongi]|uniref:Alginate export family protein n=1 Tax=Sphingomonas hankyongi TaxID=2908209 RepID=A0ABT0S302_9SPHN|nr:alginate export family protein [Sphingomonas hankyongi]MCL6730252.1 alginate export family protein [Sphingomonas hankyongi]
MANHLPTAAAAAAAFALASFPTSAAAETNGKVSDASTIQLKPILDARLRYETVDQGSLEADAITLRVRAGAEAKLDKFALLAEGEGTVAGLSDYNAFPFPLADEQRRPEFAVIADPQNVELNRLQLQYKSHEVTATVGRQRINLDDQRWVGSVGWRQNEQTFDAVRGEAKLGPVAIDLTYALSQRTIFGTDAGPRTSLDGHFIFAGVSSKLGPVQGKLFSYLLHYDKAFFLANSSQTYGGILSGTFPLGPRAKLSLRGSYARQSDYGNNPFDYAADYWSLEGTGAMAGFNLTAGWEMLGSDDEHALQTPMATLHKFNGWADLFLTTPPAGLKDAYVSIGKSFTGVKLLPGLNANLAFHQFDSAVGDVEYGTEWDASAGFKLGKIGLLLKYADYDSKGFGADTRKLWFQAEWVF